MFYQIDKFLSGFSNNIWRSVQSKVDEKIKLKITANGVVVCYTEPLTGPETDNERFFTTIWDSAKPSRWQSVKDTTTIVRIADNGSLLGCVGYIFEFVECESDADGQTKFWPGWIMI